MRAVGRMRVCPRQSAPGKRRRGTVVLNDARVGGLVNGSVNGPGRRDALPRAPGAPAILAGL